MQEPLFKYARLDSNQHILRNYHLKVARLPISPRACFRSANIQNQRLKTKISAMKIVTMLSERLIGFN